MRAVVQRTLSSRVTVDGRVISSIGLGLTVLLGIGKGDTAADADYLMDKIANLRIFPDQEGKMNLSVQDVAGEILLISQFTLYGDARKGRRPTLLKRLCLIKPGPCSIITVWKPAPEGIEDPTENSGPKCR